MVVAFHFDKELNCLQNYSIMALHCWRCQANPRSGLGRDHISLSMNLRILPKQPQSLAVVRQYMVAASASLPFAVAGSVIAWPSPILPKILAHEAPLDMSIAEMAWMVSLLYLGNLTIPVPAGYLADNYGRRKILLYSGLLSIISWLMILFGTESIHLFVARFLAGLQFGLISTIQPIYIGEISQPDIQGTLTTFNNFMFGTGSLFSFVVGPFVSYYTLALVSLCFPFLFILTFFFVPESPYFSLMKNRTETARESLFWLRGDLNRIELELELNQIERTVQREMQHCGSFKDIFTTKALRKAMTMTMVFSITKILTGAQVIMAFGSVTLPDKTFGVIDPDGCMIILGFVNVFSSLFVEFITDKLSQKVLVMVSCTGCCIASSVLALWFFLDSKTNLDISHTTFTPFVSFLIHNLFYNIACDHVGASFKSEIFSGSVKTKTTAISTTLLSLTSFIINKFYLLVSNWEGMFLNYLIFAASCLVGLLFFALYMPKTEGRTLQYAFGGAQCSNVNMHEQNRTF